jgi:hypothetical protein
MGHVDRSFNVSIADLVSYENKFEEIVRTTNN